MTKSPSVVVVLVVVVDLVLVVVVATYDWRSLLYPTNAQKHCKRH
jgi:hypothetical protein